jgi:glycerol-3-phosphate dehydrogenase
MKHYETVIIGGGIVGAGIFRDLSLHGISTLLIDKSDFASETSERSSKMLHGGIRYLENFDFKLVFEALHEKNTWIKLAPHLAYEAPFYLPVFKNSKRPLWMIKIGLLLYDFLSGFTNSPHAIKSREEIHKIIPLLKQDGLTGAGLYHDAVIDDAKMCLEVIYDGLQEAKSTALNYHELIDICNLEGHSLITIKNVLTNEIFKVSAKFVVFAVGPFTDQLLKKFPAYNWTDALLPSKGSHLWIHKNDLPIESSIVITTNDNRVIFVIPHQEKILVGTTEVPLTESLENMTISREETQYLLDALNWYFPKQNLTTKNILASYAGVRPLIRDNDSVNRSVTSREHKVFMPNSHTFVIAGGKYTTFRVMGQEISKVICHQHQKSYNPERTASPLRKKSIIVPFTWKLPNDLELELILRDEMPKTFVDLVTRRLSIASRSIWKLKTDQDFDQYFLSQTILLNRFIHFSEKDLNNFI